MKTFLTLCICAMVSAGIYGFVDMAGDVRHGTMIEYDRGENHQEKAVTIARLKMAVGSKLTAFSEKNPKIDLKDKVLDAKVALPIVIPAISTSAFYSESFSRAAPVEYYANNFLMSPATLLTAADTTAKVETTTETVTENAGTDQPISVVLATTAQPIYITPPVDTTTKVQEVIKPEAPIEFESFGRGNPGRRHKKEVVATPVADTTSTVVKKDDL